MTSRFFSKDNLSFTYQTRIRGNEEALSAYAKLFGVLQRRLFADVSAGRSSASLKSDYIRRYGIPARVFNAIRVTLENWRDPNHRPRSNSDLLSEERRPRSFTRSVGDSPT